MNPSLWLRYDALGFGDLLIPTSVPPDVGYGCTVPEIVVHRSSTPELRDFAHDESPYLVYS